MKLRTVMGPVAPCGTIEDIEHDAAAAHALMMAMDELSAWPQFVRARKRADELMRSWDFDTGEDA